jgi:hypothetical protein
VRDVHASRCAARAGGNKVAGGLVGSIVLRSDPAPPDFPGSWRVETTVKTSGKTFGRVERWYVIPSGKRFRSYNDAAAFRDGDAKQGGKERKVGDKKK